MSEKVILTAVEDKAMQMYKRFVPKGADAIKMYIEKSDLWLEPYKPLVDMGLEKFVRAWYWYEVERQFNVTDWIVYKNKTSRIVVKKDSNALGCDYCYNLEDSALVYSSQIRHATPEEIKVEKERRLWCSIGNGRSINEIKLGDAVRTVHLETFYINDKINTQDEATVADAMRWLKEGTVIGIYPVESFVSFEREVAE